MPRVIQEVLYQNTMKSIVYGPDHYYNVVGNYTNTSDEMVVLEPGTPVKLNLETFEFTIAETVAEVNGFVFSEQRYHPGESTGVAILIHGFVDINKITLPAGDRADFNAPQITILGGK